MEARVPATYPTDKWIITNMIFKTSDQTQPHFTQPNEFQGGEKEIHCHFQGW